MDPYRSGTEPKPIVQEGIDLSHGGNLTVVELVAICSLTHLRCWVKEFGEFAFVERTDSRYHAPTKPVT
jgi:hypothetical protein